MKKLIILDRDGVINYDSNDYIKNPDEWRAIPGSLEAIAELNRAGYRVVVASNQSGIGRGFYDVPMLNKIHEKMAHELKLVGGYVDEVFYCPHLARDHCSCRKPQPGLLHQIQKKYQMNLADVFFIGDKWTDIEAAKSAGCKPLLILTTLSETDLKNNAAHADTPAFLNLQDAVRYVISTDKVIL